MRAPWLEAHTAFEGVGAHELNPRYTHVDDELGEFDPVEAGALPPDVDTPALSRVQSFLTTPADVGAPYRLDGVDSARYQDPIGWDALRRRTWWHARKVSQSTGYVAPDWPAAMREMLRVEFEMMFGYHWVSSTTDPEKQAANYCRAAGDALAVMGVMADSEESPLSASFVEAFLDAVEAYRARVFGIQAPGVDYTGLFVTGGTIWQSEGIRHGSKYGPRPTILAAYTSRSKLAQLLKTAGHGKSYEAQQYSSNGAPGYGMDGVRFDMNEINDRPAFQLACGGVATPVAVDPPAPLTPPTIVIVDPSIEEQGMATVSEKRIIMDHRYNEAILVGEGAPRWISGEEKVGLEADGVRTFDNEPHQSFDVLCSRAGVGPTPRGG